MEVSGQFHDPAALPPGKETPVIHQKGGRVGPWASRSGHGEEKNSITLSRIQPRSSSSKPRHCTGWSFLAPVYKGKRKVISVLF